MIKLLKECRQATGQANKRVGSDGKSENEGKDDGDEGKDIREEGDVMGEGMGKGESHVIKGKGG